MIRLFAPAKLNLYLRVLGRRADGYHELETLFERIDLADELTLTPHPHGITVGCDDPTLDCGEGNLVTKAARLLQRTCGTTQGVSIRITKRIPIAGGLGGGSSDAAATLLGLHRLWGLPLSTERLLELAVQLGSDVPFFIGEQALAIGRGRGERCEFLTGSLPTLWHVLVAPNTRLSTKEIYAGFDARRARCRGDSNLTDAVPAITMCLHALRNGSRGELAKGFWNDLEPEAIRRCPVIRVIHTHLREAGCLGTLTSGSGPSVFGLCQDATHARQVARRLCARASSQWSVHVVKTREDSLTNGDHRGAGVPARQSADAPEGVRHRHV